MLDGSIDQTRKWADRAEGAALRLGLCKMNYCPAGARRVALRALRVSPR